MEVSFHFASVEFWELSTICGRCLVKQLYFMTFPSLVFFLFVLLDACSFSEAVVGTQGNFIFKQFMWCALRIRDVVRTVANPFLFRLRLFYNDLFVYGAVSKLYSVRVAKNELPIHVQIQTLFAQHIEPPFQYSQHFFCLIHQWEPFIWQIGILKIEIWGRTVTAM